MESRTFPADETDNSSRPYGKDDQELLSSDGSVLGSDLDQYVLSTLSVGYGIPTPQQDAISTFQMILACARIYF